MLCPRPFLFTLLTATVLLGAAASSPAADDDQPAAKSWSGTWMNRKYNSSGPLKCTATRTDDETAQATFSGTFMKDPFSYDVTVSTRQERDRTVLTGTAELDGDRYEWSGYVRGKVLYGQFRSLKGHNGEFRLTESE
jgi:hypothetical protein